MIQRGRKRVGAVVVEGGFARRPDAPSELTVRQAEIWREVVASEDDTVFATAASRGLLVDYCRRRQAGEEISKLIDVFHPDWLRNSEGALRYKQLLQMRDMEIRGATSLATKLRLTNQSRYQNSTATVNARKALARVAKPWEM